MILKCDLMKNVYLRIACKPRALGGGWGVWCEACKIWPGTDHENDPMHLATMADAPLVPRPPTTEVAW